MKSIPELIDGKIVKAEQITEEFQVVNTIRVNAPYFTERYLCRFKFVEALVRIAILKFPKATTTFAAIK